MVADNAPLNEIVTTLLAPSAASWRYVFSNCPGAGAAVSGSVGEAAHFAQNSVDAEVLAVDVLVAVDSDGQRDDLDGEFVGDRTGGGRKPSR